MCVGVVFIRTLIETVFSFQRNARTFEFLEWHARGGSASGFSLVFWIRSVCRTQLGVPNAYHQYMRKMTLPLELRRVCAGHSKCSVSSAGKIHLLAHSCLDNREQFTFPKCVPVCNDYCVAVMAGHCLSWALSTCLESATWNIKSLPSPYTPVRRFFTLTWHTFLHYCSKA